jgi:hypothetical protein
MSVTYALLCYTNQLRFLSAFFSCVDHLRPVVPLGLVALTVRYLFWCLSLTAYRDIRVSHAYC